MKNHLWIVYDGRAEYQDPDECTLYVSCESKDEAFEYVDEMFPDGVVYRYDIVKTKKYPSGGVANPVRIYREDGDGVGLDGGPRRSEVAMKEKTDQELEAWARRVMERYEPLSSVVFKQMIGALVRTVDTQRKAMRAKCAGCRTWHSENCHEVVCDECALREYREG